jgi:uncharacterized protein (TIRG00374 family)
MRVARFVLLLGGAGLFVALLVEVGPAAIAESFSTLSWRLLAVIVFPFVLVNTFDTLGWKFAFRRSAVPFRVLLLARLAGEAVNATTPSASVGGEAVKAWLLRRDAPMEETVSSVVVAKTTITIAQALFLLAGLAVARSHLPLDSVLLRAMEWVLVLECVGVVGFVYVQLAGALGGTGRILQRLGLLGTGEHTQALARTDRALADFYRAAPARLALSVASHFLGWAFSAFEVYVILSALGRPVSLETAVVIEAFGTGVRFVSFMVPAHLGAIEGGHIATFLALGLPAPLGLSFSLVRRIRELAWTGLGFLALAALRRPVLRPVALRPELES